MAPQNGVIPSFHLGHEANWMNQNDQINTQSQNAFQNALILYVFL